MAALCHLAASEAAEITIYLLKLRAGGPIGPKPRAQEAGACMLAARFRAGKRRKPMSFENLRRLKPGHRD